MYYLRRPNHEICSCELWVVLWSGRQKRLRRTGPSEVGRRDLADAFVPLEPRKIAEQPFQGTISRTDVASIQISRVEATKHVVLRLRSHIARSIGDVYFVNLQLDGVGRYTQRGHEQICGPGDLAIVDTTEPFEIANCRNFSLFCFAVPRQLLPGALAERPRLRLSATEAGRAIPDALGTCGTVSALEPELGESLPSALNMSWT